MNSLTRRRLARAAGPALVAAAFTALAWWSWGKWPDPHIDFGRELYLPWQVREGRRPWSELAIVTGPVSIYLNALWFRLFGTSLLTLALCNMALLAVLTALMHAVIKRLAGLVAAAAASMTFLGVFAFSQYGGIGNYNYICPYSHRQTHGLLLSVAALALLTRALRAGARGPALAAGALLGGALLTRMEISVPAAGAAALFFALAAVSPAYADRRPGRLAVPFLGGAAAVLASVFVILWARLPLREALKAIAGDWAVFGALVTNPFYLAVTGFGRPWENFLAMARAGFGLAALVGAAAALDVWAARRGLRAPWHWAPAAAVALILAARPDLVAWSEVGRPLPLVAAVAAAAFAFAALRNRSRAGRRAAEAAAWSLFALGLLCKILLNAKVHNYGFVLAMPGALLLVAYLLRAGGGRVFRSVAAVLVVACVTHYLKISNMVYSHKTFVLGSGADSLKTFPPIGNALAEAAREIERRAPPGATLAVWPEGALLNFLTRRSNPLMQTDMNTGDLNTAGGEDAVLADLAANPPDYIALVHRDNREFGVGFFGTDPRNGRRLMDWVRPRYRQVWLWGSQPLQDGRAGIALLEKHP